MKLTTPVERTKMRGVRQVESSTTCAMLSTGGSTKLVPRLFMMNEVTQNDTRSGRRDRTISMRCSSLHALSHTSVQTRILVMCWEGGEQWRRGGGGGTGMLSCKLDVVNVALRSKLQSTFFRPAHTWRQYTNSFGQKTLKRAPSSGGKLPNYSGQRTF